MRVCLCDERMASGSGRLTALLCGCADGLQAVCSLTHPSAPLTAKRTVVVVGGQVRRLKWGGCETGEERETGTNWKNGFGKELKGERERRHKKSQKKGEEKLM